ncbi:glutathione S-transferase [Pseudanabaena sp. 'Roaring Creek']|uniref:glutathione S-transferase n=1 Tax=Pseudanabaena sp. 'Roaring Creek' TaxID=1681830 RepID=UPI0006D82DC8|nr:glutathione S-transferase [Pseudanabaena sp. 'Roaring Creek']
MYIPILYSFRRCPYAIRARMTLAYAGIQYELREVSLKNKPQPMLDISPKGTTPVMQVFAEKDFQVLEESLDIMNWAIQKNDPFHWRDLADDEMTIAKYLIATNDREFKIALDRYKYPNRFPEKPQEFYRLQAEEFLQVLELQLKKRSLEQNSNFLISDRQTFADVAIFPFIRQFAYVDIAWFQSSPYQCLQRWLQWHETSALFELVMQKYPVWIPEQEAVIINID